MILSLLIALAAILGYWISTLVPGELTIGERWFLLATALCCIPLFFFMEWWEAAITAGALLFGQYPAIAGLGWLMTKDNYTLVLVSISIGLLIGTRWRVERRKPLHGLIALAIATIVVIVTKLI